MVFQRVCFIFLGLLALLQHPLRSAVTISSIYLADTDSSTTSCLISVMGGARCIINLNGEVLDPGNQLSICFTRNVIATETKCVALADTESPYTASNTNKIPFTVPSLQTIRDSTDYSAWTYVYNIELQISNQAARVECGVDKCQISLSLSYTPLHYHIFNAVGIYGQIPSHRVNLQSAKNNLHDSLPIRSITVSVLFIAQMDDNQCDYSTDELITDETNFNGLRVYYCRDKDYSVLTSGATHSTKFRSYSGDSMPLYSAVTVTYNQAAFLTRILPSITDVNYHSGSPDGGHLLTITGRNWPLDETKLSFSIDGATAGTSTNCAIVSVSKDDNDLHTAQCITEASPVTTGTFFPGGHGWQVDKYLGIDTRGQASGLTPDQKYLIFNADMSYNAYDSSGQDFASNAKTLFKAPYTGEYYFWLTCDDTAELYIHPTANEIPNAVDFDSATLAATCSFAIGVGYPYFYRNALDTDFLQRSAKVDLVAGNYYYMEMWHTERASNDYLQLGVEIKDPVAANHVMRRPEVQRVTFSAAPTMDTYQIELNWPTPHNALSTFNLKFQKFVGDQLTGQWVDVDINEINYSSTADVLSNRLGAYFNQYWSNNQNLFHVERNIYTNAAKNVAAATDDEAGYVTYTITMRYPVDTPRESVGRYPTITATLPEDTGLSINYTPGQSGLVGNWILKIQCPGTAVRTDSAALSAEASAWEVQLQFWAVCSDFYYKAFVTRINKFNSNTALTFAGYSYMISFDDYRGDVAEPLAVSDTTNPMYYAGNPSFIPTFLVETLWDATQDHLFFNPAPYDMFYTPHATPQVKVAVDGLLGACEYSDTTSCEYSRAAGTPQLTGTTSVDPFTTATIAGADLSITAEDYREVSFAGRTCTATFDSDAQITCTITNPIAGSYLGVVSLVASGNIEATGNPAAVDIEPTLTAVAPASVTANGGQTVTLTGTRFPEQAVFASHTVAITVGGEACESITGNTITEMSCVTPASLTAAATADIVITINGQAATLVGQLEITDSTPIGTIAPASAAMNLKQDLVITITGIAEDLSGDLTKFAASLEGTTTYPMKVNTVVFQAADTHTVTVRYPGANQGTYTVKLIHRDHGILTNDQTFQVGAKITAINPNKGSTNGGTTVTITGENFSAALSDVLVKLGTIDCAVQTVSQTVITCITPKSPTSDIAGNPSNAQLDVAVIIKITEESICGIGGGCNFDWTTDNTPTVSGVSQTGDQLTIAGTNFGTDVGDITVTLDNKAQQVDQVTQNAIIVTLTDIPSKSGALTLNVQVAGLGNALIPSLLQTLTITNLAETYTNLAPASGSGAGQLLTITGDNFAEDIAGSLKDSNNIEICASLTYVSKTELQCVSTPSGVANYANSKLLIGSTNINCATTCPFEVTLAVTPTLSGVASTDATTFVVTGTNFPTGSVLQSATIGGITTNTGVIDSDTQVTLTFPKGVGFGTDLAMTSLIFADGKHTSIDEANAKITVAFPGTLAQNVACSYAGGCLYSVTGANVNLLASSLTTTICDLPCEYDAAASTDDDTYMCRAPLMGTAYSAQTYTNLVADSNWLSQAGSNNIQLQLVTSGNELGKEAFDQEVSVSSGTTTECYLGQRITSGHQGTISKIRYFLPQTTEAQNYRGGKFQTSNDGATWTDLFEITETPMEGWNSWDRITSETTANQHNTFAYVRYFPNPAYNTLCAFGEIEIIGKIVFPDTADTKTCDAKIIRTDSNIQLSTDASAVVYSQANTPSITSLGASRFIKVAGNEQITLTGINLEAPAEVLIDNIVCTVTVVDATSITCTTGTRNALSQASLKVQVGDKGYAATNGLSYLYVHWWSDQDSWSGEFAPLDGDSIHIPTGQNLLFDIVNGPKLGAVLVEGSLLFLPDADPTHERTFDAEYIFVRNGYMEVGTETAPYTSKITFTMHGDKNSETLPIYGNKLIGVRNGVLEMHGKPRTPVWTDLYTTADVGATTMEINYDNTNNDFDWAAGDVLVLAPTDFDFTESEKVTVQNVVTDGTTKRPTVTFTPALKFKHYAGVQTYNDGTTQDTLEMRGEVGLLTRSIKFQGDQTTSKTQHGAHIMLHSPGDESVEGRFEYVELTHVGQAFTLGRYPLHFHMIGRVTKSYIKGCAIYHTFNRATTLHGVHYLTIQNNVVYDAMGHTIFVQDAAETKNRIIGNLVISTKPSNSLLNTDQTPACFWITNPDNIIQNNHCAGSKRYGFWLDYQENPTGPSFDPNICPTGERLGVFDGNVAHSVGRYGLRLFHKHIPRANPCGDIQATVDPTQYSTSAQIEDAAFAANPAIEAVYQNFLGYKCRRSAVITEITGHTTFQNIKAADCKQSGIEITRPGYSRESHGKVSNALVVGMSANAGDTAQYQSAKGIQTGQRDTFLFENIRFHNFNLDTVGNAAIGTVSHSAFSLEAEGFANTASVQGLTFTQVTHKISWDAKASILHDRDGSLTGAGGERWLTEWKPYFNINTCSEDQALDKDTSSAVCSVAIRRLNFKNPQVFNDLKGQTLKIALESDVPTPIGDAADVVWTAELVAKYAFIGQNPKKPGQWDVPFPVGQKFNVHWQYGIDWTGVTLVRNRLFRETDEGFTLRFNYTDRRDEFKVTTYGEIVNITDANTAPITTAPSNDATQELGTHKKDDVANEWTVVVNGKKEDMGYTSASTMTIETVRCSFSCNSANVVVIDDTPRYWSVPQDWCADGETLPDCATPVAGQDVVVKGGWNMIYDIESSAAEEYDRITIEGRLSFKADGDGSKHYELKAKQIIVYPGEMLIGDETTEYPDKATITLIGTPNQIGYTYNSNIMAGNKLLFVANKLIVNGKDNLEGGPTHVKLLENAVKGTNTIKVQTGLAWAPNDEIVIAASSYDYLATEHKIISAYDSNTGQVTLTTGLEFNHYGAADTETYTEGGNTYTYDLRTEVGHLTRNVVIQGNEGERWGGQLVVVDFTDTATETMFQGYAQLKHVEIKRMSQYDTARAAVRFERTGTSTDALGSLIQRSSIAHSPGWGIAINRAQNIQLLDNVIYDTYRNAIKIEGITGLIMTGNLIMKNNPREWDQSLKLKDHQFAVDLCTGEVSSFCANMQVQNNIIAGGKGGGWLIPAGDCLNEATSEENFKNNVAHSMEVGLILHIDQQIGAGQCGMFKNTLLHHNWELAAHTQTAFSKILMKNNVFVDNVAGIQIHFQNGGATDGEASIETSLFIGEHEASRDCTDSYEQSTSPKRALYSAVGLTSTNTAAFIYPQMGWLKISGDAARGNVAQLTNVVFKDFPGTGTRCNQRNVRMFETHPQASDLIMQHIFSSIVLNNVSKDTFVYLMDPPEGWANLTDCVDFPCTGPQNVLLSFTNAITLSGSTDLTFPAVPFDIISSNTGYNGVLTACTLNTNWNANLCEGDDLALLEFESLDPDKMDRSVQPVYLSQAQNKLNVKLNSFMDHIWDGFYTGQKRLTRFPVIALANTGNFHIIEYTGTPPLTQLFELYGTEMASDALKLRILYRTPNLVIVKVGGNEKARMSLSNGVPLEITGSVCGENRWLHGVNQLQFTILQGCTVNLETKNSIALSFRIDMTITDFYANDGQTNFVDRMAAALNIPQSRIRVVGFYEGSVVIESQIEEENSLSTTDEKITELETLSNSLQSLNNQGTLLGNWNVLDMAITINTYPGDVVSIAIPTIQPGESVSVAGVVMLIVMGLVVVAALALLLMYILNRKKLKARFSFGKSSAKVLHEEESKNGADAICDSEAKIAESEYPMRVEGIDEPSVAPQVATVPTIAPA